MPRGGFNRKLIGVIYIVFIFSDESTADIFDSNRVRGIQREETMVDPTQVSLINLALSHVGQASITSITDGSIQQVEVSKHWDFCLRETLKSFNWGFAKVKEALTVITAYDPPNYEYAYTYPTTCLAIRKVNDQESIDQAISGEYEVVRDKTLNAVRIVTDIEDAYIEYTDYVETVTLFTHYFNTALARRLAAELAVPLNGDKDMAKDHLVIFNNMISEAHRHDAGEVYTAHEGNVKSSFIDARA